LCKPIRNYFIGTLQYCYGKFPTALCPWIYSKLVFVKLRRSVIHTIHPLAWNNHCYYLLWLLLMIQALCRPYVKEHVSQASQQAALQYLSISSTKSCYSWKNNTVLI
jgi:hypothetical protein